MSAYVEVLSVVMVGLDFYEPEWDLSLVIMSE